ncbi:hypothetical protein F4805DRAFT_462893 [Annulohypoxylon moriforme]|nr:hypothetical protein F4805DRAFT_462893 [Annulohypoxylon moriforme]
MDADLCGIGHPSDSFDPACARATAPDSVERTQHLQYNVDVNFHAVETFAHIPTSMGNSNPTKDDNPLPCPSDIAVTPKEHVCSSSHSPNTSTVDGLLVGLSSPSTFSLYEDSSNSDVISEDEDLDLEKSAGEALSEWFGININRLIRPVRVICAFEQVKEQCANILQDEGYCLLDVQEDQDDGLIGDIRMDPYDAGEGSGPRHTGRIHLGKSNTPQFNDKKSPSNNSIQQESSSSSDVKIRGRNKKNGTAGEFACPYRKRNPLRFNVRDHMKCATTSYESISQLKKHITADHERPGSFLHTCFRCNIPFPQGYDMISHYAQCPSPPQLRTNDKNADPEEGISDSIRCRLISRGNNRINDWDTLYQALFPGDQTVPDSSFVPVVEDYEVAEKYRQRGIEICRGINAAVSRYQSTSSPNHGHLAKDVLDFIEREFSSILGRPMDIFLDLRTHSDPEIRRFPSPGSDFVHIMAEGNSIISGSFHSNHQVEMFNTPQYMTPNDNQSQILEDTRPFLANSQGVDIYPTSQAAMEMFGQNPIERSNTSQIEVPFGNPHYTRADNVPENMAFTTSEPMPWSYGYHNRIQNPPSVPDTTLLAGSGFSPTTNNFEERNLWETGSSYQFPRN